MILTFTLFSALLQAPPPSTTPPDSPVGHWIADHSGSADTPELWWNFHPDQTLTATAGFVVRSRWKLAGNNLTITPTPASPGGGSFTIHFQGGHLLSTANEERSPTLELTRIGPGTSSDTALIGAWRISNAPHATDLQEEAIRNGMMGAIFIYNADGTYELRLPLQTTTGHWSPATHTLPNHPALPFHRSGTTLSLTPPTDDQPHPYHPDPVSTP